MSADPENAARSKFKRLSGVLDERQLRLWAASEAEVAGRGGIAMMMRATGMSKRRLRLGASELSEGPRAEHRVRRSGAGRKPLEEIEPTLLKDLEDLVSSATRGDPRSPLRWTSKSTRTLAAELAQGGHQVSQQKVGQLLHLLGYSLQSPRKTQEGSSHPDRNAQFEYIAREVKGFQRRGQPIISVDTKKKELVGNYKNGGREWQAKGTPINVRVHDFKDEKLGKAIPYGVYDVFRNEGWVSVGIDHDTAEFAVESIRRWWRSMGQKVYPRAKALLITADSGGSNSARSRLWRREVQLFAQETGLKVTVLHYPPGTSKWNRIEHRMFCHITQNWRGRPLESVETVVNLIGSTKTRAGLRIRARLDQHRYEQGIEVTDDELARIRIQRHKFHGEWNYTISP